MIDIASETVVTLTQATGHVPARGKRKKPAVSTLHRWALRGVKGIRLETLMVGATRCTSIEAIQRFCERVTEAVDGPTLSASPRSDDHGTERVERELDAAGI